MPKTEQVSFKKCLIGGMLLTTCSISSVTLIVILAVWVNEGFRSALAGFGMALLLAAGAMLLTPVFGAMVSLGNRSWYAFKLWSGSGAIALVLNITIGSVVVGVAQLL